MSEIIRSNDHKARANVFCQSLRAFEKEFNIKNHQQYISIITRDALEGKKNGLSFLRKVVKSIIPNARIIETDGLVKVEDASIRGVILNSFERNSVQEALLITANFMDQFGGIHYPDFSNSSTYNENDWIAGNSESGYYAWLNILFQ